MEQDEVELYPKVIEAITLDGFLYNTDLKHFDCHENMINDFFHKESINADYENIAKTTLFINQDNNDIVGFYTVNTGQLTLEGPSNFQGSTVRPDVDCYPTVNLSYFAVDRHYQRKGYGKLIMTEFFSSVLAMQEHCGFSLILVEALNESVEFYESTGFEFLGSNYHDDFINGYQQQKYDMFITPSKLIDMHFVPRFGYRKRQLKYKQRQLFTDS